MWKNCGCVERGQTARTPALRSYYSQDTGAENQYSPSHTHTHTNARTHIHTLAHTHTHCETVDDCLYNQLIRKSCVSVCSQYLETVLKIHRRDVCLTQLIICVREITLAVLKHSKPANTAISPNVYKSTCSDWENCQITVSNHNNKHKKWGCSNIKAVKQHLYD